MVAAVFEICVNIIGAFISVAFITRYLGCKFSGKKKYAAFIICWVIASFEMTIRNYRTEFETFGMYIPIIIFACYALIALRGSVPLKIWIAAVIHLITMIITMFTNIVVCDIIGMVYLFFVEINRDYEMKMQAMLLEQQNENLKNNIADNEAFVQEMKTVRHDIKHQLLTILKYVEDEDCAAAKKYIDAITNNYMPNILTYIHTDNAAFDAAVNSKIAVCNQKGIFMEVAVKQGTKINLPQNETVILFGNLLDNAIEAAEKTEAKRIMLDIRTNGSYLVIAVRNSIAKSVLTENADFKTSKKNKELHGIGMKSIRDIVERHNGMMKFYEEGNEFCCHIMIDAE